MSNALINHLAGFSESDWLGAVEELLPEIHEVDRNAVQIWLRFYQLSLKRFVDGAENREETLHGLAMLHRKPRRRPFSTDRILDREPLYARGQYVFRARGVDPKLRMKQVEAVKANKYDDTAKTAQEILKANIMDINTHAFAAGAYQELKDTKKYDYHQAVYLGLINSIVGGADGESTKAAYLVVSRDEMIAVLRAYDLQMTGSEELVEGTSRYQVLTANDKGNGGVSKVYFNIDMIPRMSERPERPVKQ